MELGTAALLLFYGVLAASVIRRLRSRGAEAFDDRFTPVDRRLVGATAFYLAVPVVVLGAQLAQVGAVRALGGALGRFETYIYWGVVEPATPLAPLTRAGVAALGPLVLIVAAGVALLVTTRAPRSAARNHLRLELARVLLVLAFGLHPIASLLTGRGDHASILTALDAHHPNAGGVALLLYGVAGAYAFFRWRTSRTLRRLAAPSHDDARAARARLAEAPDDPEALRALGVALLEARDPRARETLSRAHALAPSDARTSLALGRACLAGGDAIAAARHLRDAGQRIEADDDADPSLLFEVTLALGAARIALGDAEGAVMTAADARAQAPSDPRGLLMWADALVAGGRRDEARAQLEAGLGTVEGAAAIEIRRRLTALRRR